MPERRRRAVPGGPVKPERRFNPAPLFLALGAAVAIGVIFQATGRSAPGEPDRFDTRQPEAPALPPVNPPVLPEPIPTDVTADPAGRVMRVTGPDPVSVLRAFCDQPDHAGMTPRWVVPAVPPSSRSRLGIVSPSGDPLALMEVPIMLDRNLGLWVIGSGRHPVTLRPAREIPPGTERTPVGRDAPF